MKSFNELNLIAPLLRALEEENYSQPTPIQSQTIPAALEHRDILGCAQTGTGKTAAFALPILNRLGEKPRPAKPNQPLALILAPTRELAIQIGESFATYGRHLRLRHVLVYGGVNQGNQVRALDRGAHVLIATPGRLLDLMEQGSIDLSQLEVFVLDEADRMLDMGFMPALKKIIRKLPTRRQSLFFSATMPAGIRELSQRLLTDPVNVNVIPEKSRSVVSIEQRVVFLDRSVKLSLVKELLSEPAAERVIVFTKTKRGANMLAERLTRAGVNAAAIHGNKSQAARQRALDAFRNQQVSVLVATDLAARGIDIDGVTHVINFDMPVEPESYVHRIGRTGRAGADGIAISLCTAAERSELRAIEDLIGERLKALERDISHLDRETVSARPDRGSQDRHASGGGHGRRSSGSQGQPARARVATGQRSKTQNQRRRTDQGGERATSPTQLSASQASKSLVASVPVLIGSEGGVATRTTRKTLPKKHRARSR